MATASPSTMTQGFTSQVGSAQYHSPLSFTMFQAWFSRLPKAAPVTVMHSIPAMAISSRKVSA